jgi:hypothetical protein
MMGITRKRSADQMPPPFSVMIGSVATATAEQNQQDDENQ